MVVGDVGWGGVVVMNDSFSSRPWVPGVGKVVFRSETGLSGGGGLLDSFPSSFPSLVKVLHSYPVGLLDKF